MGDFNEILYSHEKEGGNPRPVRMMNDFGDCLVDCELDDLGFSGDRFTWFRGDVRERLDRAVANAEWINLFPGFSVINEGHFRSDHRPVV
ncbi:hypothetical protein BRADI_5g10935v3, partial [Brachypodium distachyon]